MLIIFLVTISTTCGDPFHNYLMPYLMSKGDSGEADTNFALMLMMAQNAHHGGTGNLVYFFFYLNINYFLSDVAQQMNAMLPLIMMSKKDSSLSSDNTSLMMLMLMQQPNAVRNPSMMMPLIMLKVSLSYLIIYNVFLLSRMKIIIRPKQT